MQRLKNRYMFALTALFPGTAAQAQFDLQPAPTPKVATVAETAEEFVPKGWMLEKQVHGDLNADGHNDLAMVIRGADPKLDMDVGKTGTREVNTNPRSLLVALGGEEGGYAAYELVASNHVIIPRIENDILDDPFGEGELEIKNGALKLTIRFWSSLGAWETGPTTFTFRYRDKAMRLVGYDDDKTHRSTLDETSISVNYLTGRMHISKSNQDGKTLVDRWTKIGRKPLRRLDDIPDGWKFEPAPGYDLSTE